MHRQIRGTGWASRHARGGADGAQLIDQASRSSAGTGHEASDRAPDLRTRKKLFRTNSAPCYYGGSKATTRSARTDHGTSWYGPQYRAQQVAANAASEYRNFSRGAACYSISVPEGAGRPLAPSRRPTAEPRTTRAITSTTGCTRAPAGDNANLEVDVVEKHRAQRQQSPPRR